MIKLLQRKFVVTAMIVITSLLLVFIAGINVTNAWVTIRQSNQLLQMIADRETHIKLLPPPVNRKDSFLGIPMDEDTAMGAVYFCVRVDSKTDHKYVDTSRIASIDETKAISYVNKAKQTKKQKGKIDQFKYKVVWNMNHSEEVYVFLDASSQIHGVIRVLMLSSVMGVLCWGIMLFFTVLLSRKAIAPIAENMEKQKQFITDAGHEIKTPLASILANTEAMELITGETKWSRNIRLQTNRLTELTKNLLILARMEETTTQVVIQPISLSELVKNEVNMFVEAANQKQIQWNQKIQDNVICNTNQERVEQLVSILLDNAVKYSKQGQEVDVVLAQNEKNIEILIINTTEQANRIDTDRMFDRFYRGDSSRTQQNGGYGIGLSIARAIVEQLRGEIEAKVLEHNRIRISVKLPR